MTGKQTGRRGGDVQSSRKCFSLSLFDLLQLFPLFFGSLVISSVPMNILVFLPTTRRRVDTVAQVILHSQWLSMTRDRNGSTVQGGPTTNLSVFVRRDVRPLELGLTASSATTNRFEHVIEVTPRRRGG